MGRPRRNAPPPAPVYVPDTTSGVPDRRRYVLLPVLGAPWRWFYSYPSALGRVVLEGSVTFKEFVM